MASTGVVLDGLHVAHVAGRTLELAPDRLLYAPSVASPPKVRPAERTSGPAIQSPHTQSPALFPLSLNLIHPRLSASTIPRSRLRIIKNRLHCGLKVIQHFALPPPFFLPMKSAEPSDRRFSAAGRSRLAHGIDALSLGWELTLDTRR